MTHLYGVCDYCWTKVCTHSTMKCLLRNVFRNLFFEGNSCPFNATGSFWTYSITISFLDHLMIIIVQQYARLPSYHKIRHHYHKKIYPAYLQSDILLRS